MKFLAGLPRLLKFKRGAGENAGENNEPSEQVDINAPKNRRNKIIITGVAVVMLSILGMLAWGYFSEEPYVPRESADAWGPVTAADRALFRAVREGHAGEVRRCVLEGANVNAVGEMGVTPLKAAIALDRVEVVRELLQFGRGGAEEWYPLLVYAVVQNRPQVVKEMMKLPFNLNALDKNGYTPLLYAIDRNHVNAARELLGAGAGANVRGRDGVTPLIAAVTRGKHEMVAELLKAGADWKIASPTGETAIGIARQRHRDAIVALLMNAETPPADAYGEDMKLPPESREIPK